MKFEKAFVIGDPHFREGSVREMELFIDETLRIIGENHSRADYIVVLGDIMDRHGILHQKPFHQSCRFLIELSKILPTYCLIGNHDFDVPSKYLPENHPFKVMTWTTIPNLTIIDKPRVIHGKLFVPFVPPGMFNRAIEDALEGGQGTVEGNEGWKILNERGVGLVFAHQEFLGCHMGRIVSETGDPWPGIFGTAPFVVSGHIHDHQMVGENILYVGTPVQVNFGEGKKKGICLFTMELEDGVPQRYDLEWFSIRVPKKITKTIELDLVDGWVETRLTTLLERYSIPLPKTLASKKTESTKAFECIQKLSHNKDKLTPLMEAIRSDPFLDQIRLQVLVTNKISNTVLKNIIFKIRDLPLGVQQIFVTPAPSSPSGDGRDDPGEEEENRRGWLDQLMERVENHVEKHGLLRDILKQLSDKS